MKNKYLLLAVVTIPLVILDQATKLLIVRALDFHSSITIVQNVFEIIHTRNQGAAFGFLRDSSFRLPFLIGVSLVAVVVVIAVFRKLRSDQKLSAIGLSLILSGAIGNLLDRIRLGEVIDFLNVHWYEHYWPAFNVADSAICIGVGILILEIFLEEKRKKKGASGQRQP